MVLGGLSGKRHMILEATKQRLSFVQHELRAKEGIISDILLENILSLTYRSGKSIASVAANLEFGCWLNSSARYVACNDTLGSTCVTSRSVAEYITVIGQTYTFQ